jgi:predicted AAA+ superfamily ATPase
LISWRIFYWHTLAGNEVDFVLYGGTTFTAVEVKNTNIIRPVDYNGLASFGDDYPEASLILIYRGTLPMKHKNILVVPIEMFLKSPGEYILQKRD